MIKPGIYTGDQLSNEAYHADTEYVSGSSLATILHQCPAKWRYQPKVEKKAFEFGTAGHTNMLEQHLFDAQYVRLPSPDEFKDLLTSDAAIKSFLKDKGVTGYSAKKTDELIEMAKATGIAPPIWADIMRQKEKEAGERKLIKAEDFDRVRAMRQVVMSNGSMREVVESGRAEVSIFTILHGVPVKVRIDRITGDLAIVDYKTTRDASIEGFGRLAYNLHYYLKMALQHDVFEAVYGVKPTAVKLLAQEHMEPYVAEMYRLNDWQLNVGRNQYMAALSIYSACMKSGKWPSYGGSNGDKELFTPEFIKARHK